MWRVKRTFLALQVSGERGEGSLAYWFCPANVKR